MAILCDTPTIRDVIAFPKTSGGVDPVFKSPSPVSNDSVLEQYGLQRKAVKSSDGNTSSNVIEPLDQGAA